MLVLKMNAATQSTSATFANPSGRRTVSFDLKANATHGTIVESFDGASRFRSAAREVIADEMLSFAELGWTLRA